ncbi:MAG: alpha/beta fold hydrolase, partial [Frankiaceae bacterium]
ALRPVPIGSPGEVVLSLAGPAPHGAEPDPGAPGRYLLRTGTRGRWRPGGRLEALGTAAPPTAAAPAAPPAPVAEEATAGAAVVEEIAEAWARVLDLPVERIGQADDFFALGGNSLSALRVVLELDGLVTLTDLTRHPRLGELARLVDRRDADDLEELLHLLSSTDVGTRCALVCFPYPGGHPINFAPLSDALEELTSDIAVYGVEQPGHDPSRPGSFVGVAETARLVVEEIAERISAPLVLWGHCGGASITVEVARQLEEQGFDLRHVLVGSKLLPADQDMRESIEMIEGWADEDILGFLRSESGYTDLDGLPQQHNDLLTGVFRHDVLGGYRYFLDRTARADRRIAAPFTVVVAGDDPGLPHEPVHYRRWGELAADLRTHVIEGGGHYFVRTNPVGTAELICRTWEDAMEKEGESA